MLAQQPTTGSPRTGGELPLLGTAAADPPGELAEAIHRPFFKAGIVMVLSFGAVWGAYLLIRIALQGQFTAISIHDVNAHGHAQIFGWVGLFVMGFAYQVFPRWKQTTLAAPRLAQLTLAMMLTGLVVRSLAQPLFALDARAWWPAVGAAILEAAAAVLFVNIIVQTWRRSGRQLAHYEHYLLAGLMWFVVQAVYEAVYLAATLGASGGQLVALVATWQAPLRDIQIHGFALLMILGVSQRIFQQFYGLPQPSVRLSRVVLVLLNAAVVGEVAGLVLMRTAGPRWAGLWYLSVLVLAAACVLLVASWRIFSPAPRPDRSLKFLRAAYVWLFISLAMLVLLPAYQFGLLAWLAPASHAVQIGFSHAFHGAIRHAITVGFVSLMIVGVAARVVPMFQGLATDRLSPLIAPFVLINLGCALRVVGQTWTDFAPAAFPVTGVSGLLEVTGLALWGAHLWSIFAQPRPVEPPAIATEPAAQHGMA